MNTYDPSVITRCVESGGVTDRCRGLLWLTMVGMDPTEAKSKGVLGVMAHQQPESPEEQYDRLHRAMNGTATAPVDHSAVDDGPSAMSRESSAATPSAAPSDNVVAESKSATVTANGGSRAGSGTMNERQQDNNMDGDPFIDTSTSANGTRTDLGTGSSRNSKAEGSAGSGSGGDSGGTGSGEAGGFSVGDESVVLWEESSVDGSAPAAVAAATVGDIENGGSGSQHNKELGQTGVPDGDETDGAPADGVNTGGSTQTSAAEGFTAAEVGSTNTIADCDNGTKQAGGRGREETGTTQESDTGTDGNAGEEGENGEGALKSADEAQDAVKGEGDMVAPSTAAPARVVGWASGLFRRTSTTTFLTPPSVPDQAGNEGQHRRRETLATLPSNPTSPVSGSRMSRGLLFNLRYARIARPKSELPAEATSRSFFGDSLGSNAEKGMGDARLGDDNPTADIEGFAAVERVPGLYSALLNSADAMDANDITGVRGPKQSCFVDIEKDLQRTLGMTDVTALRNVLRCISTFVPDVGYVQGMNFVCRCLLQVYDDEEEAFWVFVGMLQKFGLRRLYCPGMPLLRLRFFQLNRLLMWHLPNLYGHFEACGITADLFATSWFVTLLSDGGMLPDGEVKVLWDRIFLHASSPASQWSSVFLVLLELLRRAEDTLIKETRFSELIQRLVNMPFRDLCEGRGACAMMKEAGRRFETSSPMPVQLLLLRDQWMQGGDADVNAELGEKRQLM